VTTVTHLKTGDWHGRLMLVFQRVAANAHAITIIVVRMRQTAGSEAWHNHGYEYFACSYLPP